MSGRPFTFPTASTTDRLTAFRMLWQRGESASDSGRGFNPPEFGPGHAGHRESAKLVQTAAETSPVSK